MPNDGSATSLEFIKKADENLQKPNGLGVTESSVELRPASHAEATPFCLLGGMCWSRSGGRVVALVDESPATLAAAA